MSFIEVAKVIGDKNAVQYYYSDCSVSKSVNVTENKK